MLSLGRRGRRRRSSSRLTLSLFALTADARAQLLSELFLAFVEEMGFVRLDVGEGRTLVECRCGGQEANCGIAKGGWRCRDQTLVGEVAGEHGDRMRRMSMAGIVDVAARRYWRSGAG